MTRDRADPGRPRPDGGRRMPGVPASSADDDQDRAAEREEPDEGAADERTASGRRMPGVPASSAEDDQDRAADEEAAGGEACGAGEAPDHDPEHGLTTAISLESLKRVEDPAGVIADAKSWSDWVGVVGDASGPQLNAFFRSHGVDVDFFNDVSDGPAERLAKIDEDHHFYADRRVLICLPEERSWAERAGWEAQAFADVAEEANWRLAEA